MDKIRLPRKFKVYLPLLCLLAGLVLMMPRSPKFKYDYRKGAPWMYETLIAQFDFPVLKTDAQMLQEQEKAASAVVPYYRLDVKVAARKMAELSSADFGRYAYAKAEISEALASIYEKGVAASFPEGMGETVGTGEGIIYLQRDRRAEKVPVSEVYTLDDAKLHFRAAVARACPGCNIDSLLTAAGLADVVAADLVFDRQTTDLVHAESIDYVSRTSGVVRAGQVIVSHGEIVTAEIEQLLDSYKAEYDTSVGYDGPVALQWLGNFLISLALVFVLFFAIHVCNPKIFDEYNKYLYLLLVFTISAVASFTVARIDSGLFYLVPFTLIALYLLAFFKKRMVFCIYIISLIPMLIFAPNGVELFVIYLAAGVVAMLVFGRFNRGWLQFVTAFIVFLVMVTVWGAFRLADEARGITDYHTVLNILLGAMLSVAGYPLIYLFEKIFFLVSNSKLVELSDTSNKLLRMLADKAPGTFQHSLQIMNLADAAARSIDANVLLVRAGALYHDIGKINNPQCFTENETPGVKYHDGLTPKESAQEIIRHVSDGLALAEKFGLPDVIRQFIVTHHGTTCTAYFYNKYLNDGGDPADVAEFYYDGVKPKTKEQVVLMLCDAVEAASRSLKNYSAESVSELVERIINGKVDDGQLSDADISLRELIILKDAIKSYLQQMYHSRVVYPKRKS